MELQAQEYLKQKNWIQAIDLYNKLLSNKQITLEQVISYLTIRAECFMEINNYQAVIADSKQVIKLIQDHNNHNVCLARKRLIHCLCLLKRFTGKCLPSAYIIFLLNSACLGRHYKLVNNIIKIV